MTHRISPISHNCRGDGDGDEDEDEDDNHIKINHLCFGSPLSDLEIKAEYRNKKGASLIFVGERGFLLLTNTPLEDLNPNYRILCNQIGK